MRPILVFVKRNQDAIGPENDLDVEHASGDLGLENIHPLAGRRGSFAPRTIFSRQPGQYVAGVLFIEV